MFFSVNIGPLVATGESFPFVGSSASLALNPHIGSSASSQHNLDSLLSVRIGPVSDIESTDGWVGGRNVRILSIIPTTFFDFLVSDMPAAPTNFDGEYSFSNRAGAYHVLMGIGRDQQNERYAFFCAKKASSDSFSVRFQHPISVEETLQVTSKYARYWKFPSPGTFPPQEHAPPDEYCYLGLILSPGGVSYSPVRELVCQVYPEWVVFSGTTTEDANVSISIFRMGENIPIRTLSVQTVQKSFIATTYLEPGEYRYEVCATSSIIEAD